MIRASALGMTVVLLFWWVAAISGLADDKPAREEGVFHIRLGDNEVGTERFTIANSGETVSSTSVLDFRNPAETHQHVQMETRLEMNARYVPVNYQLKSDVDGKKGMITGTFTPGQAMFEYTGAPTPRKTGVLVGKEFTVLDSNIFHHFIFLVRRFDFDSKEKVQKFEVVIPQETDSGILSISEAGKESIRLRGKKIDTTLLQIDSGALTMRLWVGRQRTLVRIAVPSRQIEVDRE